MRGFIGFGVRGVIGFGVRGFIGFGVRGFIGFGVRGVRNNYCGYFCRHDMERHYHMTLRIITISHKY